MRALFRAALLPFVILATPSIVFATRPNIIVILSDDK